MQQIKDSHLNLYRALFINNETEWFQQHRLETTNPGHFYSVDPSKKWYRPLDNEVINKHLSGDLTCSWYANDDNDMCKWLAFDNDHDNDNLERIKSVLSSVGFTAYGESRRPGREGHLWLLLDEPIDRTSLCLFGDEIRRQAGVSNSDIEMYPTTKSKRSKLRGPLGINRKAGANKVRGLFEEARSADAEEQLDWLAGAVRNDTSRIIQIADLVRSRQPAPCVNNIVVSNNYKENREFATILDIIPSERLRRLGSKYFTQCPVCANEGHDEGCNNLQISNDGKIFCCWYGNSPGKIHTKAQIFSEAKRIYAA
ncbi:hypothetical protein BH11CYA1_BH11CYA1_11560 [soil metagenome]